VPSELLPGRHPRGTNEKPLTAASFRTWQGSRGRIARDPTPAAAHMVRTKEDYSISSILQNG